jgi:hypothetical protein
MASIPHLKQLVGRYKNQGLVLIGVHSDKDAAKMKSTVKTMGMTWPIAQDGQHKMLDSFKANGFPTYCLVDRKGRLRVCDGDPDDLDRAIGVLLRERRS